MRRLRIAKMKVLKIRVVRMKMVRMARMKMVKMKIVRIRTRMRMRMARKCGHSRTPSPAKHLLKARSDVGSTQRRGLHFRGLGSLPSLPSPNVGSF